MKRGLSIAIAVMFAISFQTGDVWSAVTVGQDVFRSVKKELIAVKIEEPPAIDGTLNDVCWKNARKRSVSPMSEPKNRQRINRSPSLFIRTPHSMSRFTSTMTKWIKLWHVRPKTRPGFVVRIGSPSPSIRFTHTNTPIETSLWQTRSAPNSRISLQGAQRKANGSGFGKSPRRLRLGICAQAGIRTKSPGRPQRALGTLGMTCQVPPVSTASAWCWSSTSPSTLV